MAFKLTSHAGGKESQEAVAKLCRSAPLDYVVHNDLRDHLKGQPLYTIYNGRGEALSRHSGGAALATALETLSTPPEPESFHDLMP